MSKVILLFSVLFTSVFPILVSNRSRPVRTLRMIQISTVVVVFLWAFACRVWYPRVVFPE